MFWLSSSINPISLYFCRARASQRYAYNIPFKSYHSHIMSSAAPPVNSISIIEIRENNEESRLSHKVDLFDNSPELRDHYGPGKLPSSTLGRLFLQFKIQSSSKIRFLVLFKSSGWPKTESKKLFEQQITDLYAKCVR